MKITKQQINDISQSLEAGMKVFINCQTLEYRSVLDWDEMMDPEFSEKEIEEIENEWTDYIIVQKMESFEAFKVMEDFCDDLEDEPLKEDLLKILNRKSHFANFKIEIDSSDYREKWFSFRQRKYEEYVMRRLESEEIEFEK
jgi:hypothetical protein